MTQEVVFAQLGSIGMPELVIIFLIIMVIFGASRLSGLGKGLGQAIRGFKEEMKPQDEDPVDPPRDV